MGLDASALHDDLLANMPKGARHDAQICPFCIDKASTHASVPSGVEPSGATSDDQPRNQDTEGGTPPMTDVDMISRETHEALLAKALGDAAQASSAALAAAKDEASRFSSEVDRLTAELAQATTENEATTKALDEAQVQLKSAIDEVAALKTEAAEAADKARKIEVASKRAAQVGNLALFPKEYIDDKASKWADLSEEEWGERLEEWRNLKPAPSAGGDTASAMTGTSEDLTKDPSDKASANPPSARRAILGLTS